MYRKLTVILCTCFSVNAFAQAEKFEGFSIGFNSGVESNQLEIVSSSVNLGAHSTPFNINSSYTFALSPLATFSTGITYDISNATAATSTTANLKLKNHYSINLEPGYTLSESTLGYLKIAYHSATSSVVATNATYNKNTTGWGYGFGSKFNFDKNLYLNLEVQQIIYSAYQPDTTVSSGKVKHTSTLGTIGLGYRF